MKNFNCKEVLSRSKLVALLCYMVLGLLIMLLFGGKSHTKIRTIAVSPDERYIACFEVGTGHKIRCFCADGSLAFDYNIPSDISAGGYCTLWFEGDVLYSLYYRTNKVVCFSADGTILDVFENESDNRPSKFPAFTRKGNQYIFNGDKIDVIYDKRSFFGYWIFGAERYLAITPQEGETKIAYAWTAKTGDGLREPY